MTLLNFKKVFTIEMDASNLAIGVVISQKEKPIDFFSKKLNDLKTWRCCLLSKEFVVYTDNHGLIFLNS